MAEFIVPWPQSFEGATELPPEQVGMIIEALIAELDKRDGDPDLEDDADDMCAAGDDGCGPFWHGGHLHWGSTWESAETE